MTRIYLTGRTQSIRLSILLIAAMLSGALAEEIEFNRDIRPLLADSCFACHGPDKQGRQGGLRLDLRHHAVEAGAFVPGDVKASAMVERIESTDQDLLMPPPTSGKMLTDQQRELLKRWIEQGANYQDHWSFLPVPQSVSIPQGMTQWSRQPIDRFVADKLKQKTMAPADQSSPLQWLRRVSLDLTGLPASLEEIKAFESDDPQQAYERVVDRLLASPAYGERMATMWLDVARYADTFGYQSDVACEVWPWREWVIGAFNQNMTYDRFLTWQLAGDLLPEATQQQKLATAFCRLHRQTNEGGSIVEEFRVANVADRTTTTATAFLGLTMECCRCHDHKYDPLSQQDFYKLSAYFANIDELGVYSHFTFSAPTPALPLYTDQQLEKHRSAEKLVEQWQATWQQQQSQALAAFNAQANSQPIAPPTPTFQLPLDGGQPGLVGSATKFNGDDEVKFAQPPLLGRCDPFSISLWVMPAVEQPRMLVLHQSVAAEDSAFRGLQLTLNDGYPEFSLIHFWPGNAVSLRSVSKVPVNDWSHLCITYDGSSRASGIRLFVDGRLSKTKAIRDQLSRDIVHRSDWGDMSVGNVQLSLGARFRDIGFRDGLMDDLQLFDRPLSQLEVRSIFSAVRKEGLDPLDDQAQDQLFREHWLLTSCDSVKSAFQELVAARRAENEAIAAVSEIMVMRTAAVPQPTHFLNRGEYHNRGPEVQPATPAAIGEGVLAGDRLALAAWMTNDRNPLVSRVIVNRLWYMLFGRGLVASLEDFGSQGTPPSHPELLDWLARDFMQSGWDIKALIKQIVLTQTYRQSSIPRNPELLTSDPDNIWLARGPKHRLSAEQIRDLALAASGLLVKQMGGPSVMPYQPVGLWEEAGTGKSYQQSKGDGLYRRSLYTFWKRTAPPPTMITFDATSREVCTARREQTTTPLQALVLLNDPQFVECARVLSERLLRESPNDLQPRWQSACLSLMTRRPTSQECQILNQLYDQQLELFAADSDQAAKLLAVGERPVDKDLPVTQLAATTVVVATLLNYDETQMKR